jgi:outer membrane protein assembly factor BamE (lipoprotein component of BamABCDE complex)
MITCAKRAFLLLLLAAVYGCITVGRDFISHDFSWIVPNKTTRKEVRTVLGEPFRVGVDAGYMTWSYGYYRYSLFGEEKTKDLVIYFNKDGTVKSYTFNTSFPEEKKRWEGKAPPQKARDQEP